MAEYIDREATVGLLENKYQDMSAMPASYYAGFQYALNMLKRIPSAADVAPVVRCKDCCWGQMDDLGIMHCHKYHMHKNVDGFCDEGERKEPENENTYSSI